MVYGGARGCGLGNRITAICGGYAAAKVSGSDFSVCWNRGTGCDANWDELFKPPTLFDFTKKVPRGAITHREPSYIVRRRPKHFHAIGSNGFTPEYWAAWRECARSIELIDDLQLPERRGFIAVSIRANFGPRAPSKQWWGGMVLPDGAFICSDSQAHFAKALEICKDPWFLSSPVTNRDMGNRGLQGVQAAARDMMMLCRAQAILAVGNRSTLRNMASIGHQVPVYKLHEGRNP